MRISTQQMFGRSLNSMQDVNSQLQKTQMQISTGKKILSPADDPYATTRVSQISQSLSQNTQFQKNIDLAQNRLEQQDSLLNGVSDILLRVRELTTQAGNGTLNSEDKTFIANELKQRLDQLAGLMNSQDAGGEYVFAGFQGNTVPFQKNGDGRYVYQGDEGQRYVQVDTMVSVATNENGKTLFVDVPNASYGKVQTTSTTAIPSNEALLDESLLQAIYPQDLTITYDEVAGAYAVQPATDANGNPITAELSADGSGTITISVAGTEAMTFRMEGTPEDGDQFVIESRKNQGILSTLENLIAGLENVETGAAGQKAYFNMIDETLGNLANAETTVLNARSRIGARLNTIETTRELHGDVEVLGKQVMSDLQDVDYAEAISRLSMESFVLQAAQQTYSRVNGLSLFDHL